MVKTLIAAPLALAMAVGLALPTAPAVAEPGGCLKYGAAGAVGGHLAHHGVLGAAGGCVTGMYVRHRYRKNLRHDAEAYRNGQANPDMAPQGPGGGPGGPPPQ